MKVIFENEGIVVQGLGSRNGRRKEKSGLKQGGPRHKKEKEHNMHWIHHTALEHRDKLVEESKVKFEKESVLTEEKEENKVLMNEDVNRLMWVEAVVEKKDVVKKMSKVIF